MSDRVFCSSYFFENDLYVDLQENVFVPRKRAVCEEFNRFLMENLKELEFKKVGTKTYLYSFDVEEKKKGKDPSIKVVYSKEAVTVIAMKNGKSEDTDIDQAVVTKGKNETFVNLMDRVMDALEVVECAMFGLDCNTKLADVHELNPEEEQSPDAQSPTVTDDEQQRGKDEEVGDEYEPEGNDENEEDDDSDDNEEDEDVAKEQEAKRRSPRLRNSRKRKRKSVVESEEEEEEESTDDGESAEAQKPRKRRKVNKSRGRATRSSKTRKQQKRADTRARNREIAALWVEGEYVAAIHLAEDEYKMKDKEINDLVEMLYDNGL